MKPMAVTPSFAGSEINREYNEMSQPEEDVNCADCGQTILHGKVVGCPDGAEICHECFDSGRR